MKTTAVLFDAFLKCPTKCYLRSTAQTGSGNAYAEWLQSRQDRYRAEATKRLLEAVPQADRAAAAAVAGDLKKATWRLAVNLPLETGTTQSTLQAVERTPSPGRGKAAQFTPVCFTCFNKLTNDDRSLLAFDALVLAETTGRKITVGKIIHGDDHAPLKVNVGALLGTVRKLADKMAAMLDAGAPPDLALNRHCGECEFREQCRASAIERDDLSLLPRMTEKERNQFRHHGIFTVTQLSYTFRPRRRPKQFRDNREKYHHALKALAIRERKIHLVGTPEVKIAGTPVYLDVEGLPDRDCYYLIGLRVGNGESAVQHSLWADDPAHEKTIWRRFLSLLESIDNPVLMHYGHYEAAFFKAMGERYGTPRKDSVAAGALRSPVNVVSLIFARIYFPTFSNGLKEVASWLGFKWSGANPSGAESIRWRTDWEDSGDVSLKEHLISYNADDCQALQVLTDALLRICRRDRGSGLQSGTEPPVVLAEESLSKETLWPHFSSSIEDFDAINSAARWDAQRDSVYFRTPSGRKHASRARQRERKRSTHVNKHVVCTSVSVCSVCAKHMEARGSGSKTVYDIAFSRHGLKRWTVTYHYKKYWCRSCGTYNGIPEFVKLWGLFGRTLVMYCVYQMVDLCITQRSVSQHMNRLFGYGLQHYCPVIRC